MLQTLLKERQQLFNQLPDGVLDYNTGFGALISIKTTEILEYLEDNFAEDALHNDIDALLDIAFMEALGNGGQNVVTRIVDLGAFGDLLDICFRNVEDPKYFMLICDRVIRDGRFCVDVLNLGVYIDLSYAKEEFFIQLMDLYKKHQKERFEESIDYRLDNNGFRIGFKATNVVDHCTGFYDIGWSGMKLYPRIIEKMLTEILHLNGQAVADEFMQDIFAYALRSVDLKAISLEQFQSLFKLDYFNEPFILGKGVQLELDAVFRKAQLEKDPESEALIHYIQDTFLVDQEKLSEQLKKKISCDLLVAYKAEPKKPYQVEDINKIERSGILSENEISAIKQNAESSVRKEYAEKLR